MKKIIFKVIISIIALAVLGTAIYFVTKAFEPKSDGTIVVEVIDLDGQTIKSKEIEFVVGDELTVLIQENFANVTYDDGMIVSIENYTTPSDWSTFLSLYVDDEMSMVGLAQVEFKDGTIISLRITKFDSSYE